MLRQPAFRSSASTYPHTPHDESEDPSAQRLREPPPEHQTKTQDAIITAKRSPGACATAHPFGLRRRKRSYPRPFLLCDPKGCTAERTPKYASLFLPTCCNCATSSRMLLFSAHTTRQSDALFGQVAPRSLSKAEQKSATLFFSVLSDSLLVSCDPFPSTFSCCGGKRMQPGNAKNGLLVLKATVS